MLFVLVMFKKCATCTVVLCVKYGGVEMYHGVREEWLLSREGRRLFESRPCYGNGCVGVLSIQVDFQITSRVRLVVWYYIYFTTGCRPYDFRYNSTQSGRSPIHVFQRQESSTL